MKDFLFQVTRDMQLHRIKLHDTDLNCQFNWNETTIYVNYLNDIDVINKQLHMCTHILFFTIKM